MKRRKKDAKDKTAQTDKRPARLYLPVSCRVQDECPRLPAGANPRAWERLAVNDADEHRFFGCRFYNLCLDYAIYLRWRSWTCRYCKLWNEDTVRTASIVDELADIMKTYKEGGQEDER